MSELPLVVTGKDLGDNRYRKEGSIKHIRVTALGKPEVLQLVDGPMPTCAANEVMIKVTFAGIGGIDAIVRRGDLGAVNPQPPFTPGLASRWFAGRRQT